MVSESAGQKLTKGAVITSGLFPERVAVVSVEGGGDSYTIIARGLESGNLHERILTREQIETVSASLPEGEVGFSGNADDFFLAMEARRIRLAFEFDPLFALNASRVDPVPHQLEAVYKYMLPHHRAVRYLLADDPGAGKTIMTGLLLKELKMRGLVGNCLIVVPGHLKYQWLRELKEKFGEQFAVVDRGTIESSYGTNVWKDRSWCITSLDFLRQEDIKATVSTRRWDLVVVDEAHNMAAYQYGDKTERTKRYQVGEVLARTAENLLFLTATPHRGDPDNFRLLLALLDPDVFASRESMERVLKEDREQYVLRRMKEELKGFDGKRLFPPRDVLTVGYELSRPEQGLYDDVTEYVSKYYRRAQKIRDVRRRQNITLALIVLQRRAASSVRALRTSLENRRRRLQERLDNHRMVEEAQAIYGDLEDMPEEDRWRIEEALEAVTTAENFGELRDEIAELDRLIDDAKKVERAEVETKLTRLKQLLDERVRRGSPDEKLLVFTEAKATLDYLKEKLTSWGYSVCTIHGNMNLEARIAAEEQFRHSCQVLVATEAAGEGVNLQFCWMMVNYDIPWNPNRLEQRMGRIHRYGQKHPKVFVFNMVAVNTREGRVMERLLEKIETMKEHLGEDKVYDVVGDILENAGGEELLRRVALGEQEVAEAIEQIDAISVEQTKERISGLVNEALAVRVDESWSREQARISEENKLIPEYLEHFFIRAFETVGGKGRLERRADGFLRIERVPAAIRNVGYDFRMRYGLVDDRYPRLTFSNELARAEETADFLAPGHPLMESVIENALAKCGAGAQAGAVFEDPDGRMNGVVWFLEGSVSDGTGKTVGKRMFAVYAPVGGAVQAMHPAVLWDLKPSARKAPEEVTALAAMQDEIVAHVVAGDLTDYRRSLLAEREREVAIRRKYGVAALKQRIDDLDIKMTEYLEKGGSEDDLAFQNWDRDMDALEHQKAQMEESLEREQNLTLARPRVLGVAAVIPAVAEGRLSRDPEIEAIGMRFAMEHERKHGRTPRDVSAQKVGYDVVSEDETEVRYIEVKARVGEGAVFLTPNEWMTARQLKEKAWLYVVANCGSKPKLYATQDPANRLSPVRQVETVRYVVAPEQWKKVVS